MPTLWSLGDSYAEKWDDDRNYIRIIGAKLDLNIKSGIELAIGGTSLPHLFITQWLKLRDRIGTGDLLLIALTSPTRTYFWEKYPRVSNTSTIKTHRAGKKSIKSVKHGDDSGSDLTDQEIIAFNDYYVYLHRNDLHLAWLQTWLIEVDLVCARAGANAVILDCFGDLKNLTSSNGVNDQLRKSHIASHLAEFGRLDGYTGLVSSTGLSSIIRGHGDLYSVSLSELGDDVTRQWFLNNDDPRMNHLGADNHTILANKIVSSVTHRTKLDLTSGWHTNYIKTSYFSSNDWLQQHMSWPLWTEVNKF